MPHYLPTTVLRSASLCREAQILLTALFFFDPYFDIFEYLVMQYCGTVSAYIYLFIYLDTTNFSSIHPSNVTLGFCTTVQIRRTYHMRLRFLKTHRAK
jgi:hypothetical protein